MRAARPFIKHLAGLIGGLRLVGDFGPDLAFQHIRKYEPGMAVCLANPSGWHIDFAYRHFPAVQADVGQILFEHRTAASRRRPILSTKSPGPAKQS